MLAIFLKRTFSELVYNLIVSISLILGRKKPLNTINLNCHTLSKAQEESPASVRGPDEIFGCDGVREELRRQKRKPDSGQKLRQVEAALHGIELDPTHHRREDDLLGGNVKLVVGQKFLHLLENSISSV